MSQSLRTQQKIKKSNIKKGFTFFWYATGYDFTGLYEVVCYIKRNNGKMAIYALKPTGKRATKRENGQLAIFDERIINNPDFVKI